MRKKIGLICNQNNLFFGLGRHLRDAGYDVTLLLANNEASDWPHFHPSAGTFDLDYQDWTRTLSWGDGRRIARHDPHTVERDLAPFDFLFGCGSAPAYLARIGRPLDVFMPFGSDLCEEPFRAPAFTRHSVRSLVELPRWQRAGVRACKVVIGDRSVLIEEPLARLSYKGRRVFGVPPLLYTPLFSQASLEGKTKSSHWYPVVKDFRDKLDVLVFMHARHVWKNPTKLIWSKGNDKLLRAVADLRAERPDVRVGVVTCEYGPDVLASRQLVSELGLDDRVLWLPVSPRKELMVLMTLADLAVGELGHSWFIAGTVHEALAMGKPLLHRREDADFEGLYPELYPMFDIKETADATRVLRRFVDSPAEVKQVGVRGRAWFEEHAIRRSLELTRGLIHGTT
jgi:glycosyltransferase involved in cell wall biosynthesis